MIAYIAAFYNLQALVHVIHETEEKAANVTSARWSSLTIQVPEMRQTGQNHTLVLRPAAYWIGL